MKKMIVEGLGTFLLVLVILMLISHEHDIQTISLGVGVLLIGIIYGGGPISKAHYNPAVTLAFFLRGKITSKLALAYVSFQILGSLLAVWVQDILFIGDFTSTLPNPGISSILIAELIGTSFLVFVILRVATAASTEGNEYYGLAIASTVVAGILVFGPVSGAAFNPAVSFSFSLVGMGNWSGIIWYLLAQFAASWVAWGIYLLTASAEDLN